MATKLISTMEAAEIKDCTRHTIGAAIQRGALDGEKAGRNYVVIVNKRFQDWQPNPVRQQIGRESRQPKGRKGQRR